MAGDKGYTEIAPIFASSHMRISHSENTLFFSNVITYDYIDKKKNDFWKNYQEFLSKPKNLDAEIELYWNNLQNFLDEEINKINGKIVNLDIQHCSIGFRDNIHPFVQWVVEFQGSAHKGINKYENFITEEILEYPIYSLYMAGPAMQFRDIKTTLTFSIDHSGRFVEYSGEPGQKLGAYESLSLFI